MRINRESRLEKFSGRRSRYAGKTCLIRENDPCEGGFASGRLFTIGIATTTRPQQDSSVRIRLGGPVGRRTRMLMWVGIRCSSAIQPGWRLCPAEVEYIQVLRFQIRRSAVCVQQMGMALLLPSQKLLRALAAMYLFASCAGSVHITIIVPIELSLRRLPSKIRLAGGHSPRTFRGG